MCQNKPAEMRGLRELDTTKREKAARQMPPLWGTKASSLRVE
jgi:hypothetical protein